MMADPGDYFLQLAYPTITVTVPNSGESWRRGTQNTITWTYLGNPGAYVKIELLKAGLPNKVITGSTPIGSNGTGSYSWAIPGSQAADATYQIRVTSTSNSGYADTSDACFTISK